MQARAGANAKPRGSSVGDSALTHSLGLAATAVMLAATMVIVFAAPI
jgi:hypothetical protein